MRRFCSRGCCLRFVNRIKSEEAERTFTDRAIELIGKTDNPDECWLWQGSIEQKNGYGRYKHKKKYHKAHRLVYEIYNGPIPEGNVVRHTCDNPPCVNPKHLLAGTVQDNTDDMFERERFPLDLLFKSGVDNPMAKLTIEQEKEIRLLYTPRTGAYTQSKLSTLYNVSQSAIGK